MQLQNPPNSCQTMPMLLSSDDLDEMLTRIHSSAAAGSLESQTLDFKQTPPNRMEAVKTLVEASICFANGHSGTVVVAVADATGGPGSFTGCDLDPATVQRRIYELTEPHLMAGDRAVRRVASLRHNVSIPIKVVLGASIVDRPWDRLLPERLRMGFGARTAPGRTLATVGPRATSGSGQALLVVYGNRPSVVLELDARHKANGQLWCCRCEIRRPCSNSSKLRCSFRSWR